ncbi:calcitonin-1 isoform X1 [Etheostoma spectabile]|uniref:calcitonin-1 isoform X1 n=2 Tax=Etheostoma spectabile TaxID=54343 RepID=UPI0013AF806D|nr:calcitonin gene-related peptide 2 isoform X1 [Etheostoma spectabile]
MKRKGIETTVHDKQLLLRNGSCQKAVIDLSLPKTTRLHNVWEEAQSAVIITGLTVGTMVMLKISAFLVAYALVICQMYCSQAAPARPGLESMSDRVTLTDYESRRLLNAIVKEFLQMTAEELEQQATEGNSMDRPITKRCSNLSTCVLGKLSQDLHKLQTFPRTNVGAGTPGKKRSAPESDSYASYGETFDSI